MYGRRRVGKTTILLEFLKKHKAFFSLRRKKDDLNLEDFSRTVQEFFDGNYIAYFPVGRQQFLTFPARAGEKRKQSSL